MTIMNKILIIALALLTPSCFISRSTVDRPLDESIVGGWVAGQTTAQEVAASMGAPAEVVQLGLRTAWRYEYQVQKQSAAFLLVLGLRGVDSQSDRVWVFFNEQGVLTHVGTSFASADASYAIPGF